MSFDFEKATHAELVQWKNQQDWSEADPAIITQVEALMTKKLVAETVKSEMVKVRAVDKAQKMDEKAYNMWPELKDKESDFYKKVSEQLGENPNNETDPGALYHTANSVGLELGMAPAGVELTSMSSSGGMKNIGGGESGGEPEDSGDGESFVKATPKIAQALGLDMNDDKIRQQVIDAVEANDNG